MQAGAAVRGALLVGVIAIGCAGSPQDPQPAPVHPAPTQVTNITVEPAGSVQGGERGKAVVPPFGSAAPRRPRNVPPSTSASAPSIPSCLTATKEFDFGPSVKIAITTCVPEDAGTPDAGP